MIIVFDMDNTLVDELGSTVRPGIIDLLTRLKQDGHTLILWTSSSRERARTILHDHKMEGYFTKFVFREDYDTLGKGVRKDIRKVNGDILIDDDPKEIKFVKEIKKDGVLISPFRQRSNPSLEELDSIYAYIKKKSGWFKRFFG